ncbi:hypothetical protein PMIN05_006636 [Paraphaeosphaeria minitans]
MKRGPEEATLQATINAQVQGLGSAAAAESQSRGLRSAGARNPYEPTTRNGGPGDSGLEGRSPATVDETTSPPGGPPACRRPVTVWWWWWWGERGCAEQ